ncbi:hypothetical protein ACQPW1_13215 [Nocardia sp. CA-128927]|uniref:hypothetical protein n=1 Tax=Nocardia sp. CA-128927 TaxID=3239975 RepID=UPI003D96EE87
MFRVFQIVEPVVVDDPCVGKVCEGSWGVRFGDIVADLAQVGRAEARVGAGLGWGQPDLLADVVDEGVGVGVDGPVVEVAGGLGGGYLEVGGGGVGGEDDVDEEAVAVE